MTSIFAEAWSDTRKDVRRGARRWLRRHPTSNLLAWGATTVTWTLPKKGLLAYHKKAYRPRVTVTGRRDASTVTTTETVTVTSTTGNAIDRRTTTTTGAEVIHMSTTSRLLGRGDLARTYATIIDQTEAWAPIQDYAANSIVEALTDLKASTGLIMNGIESLAITFTLGNIDRRVRSRMTDAIAVLGDVSTALQRAATQMHRIYTDQINQESSGVPMATAAVVGGQHGPLETRPAASRAGLLVSAWLPDPDHVITSVGKHLVTNKLALSLWGRSLDGLSGRLRRYGVHLQVRHQIDNAAEELRMAGALLHEAHQLVTSLYAAQADAESAGATVTPIHR